MNAFSLRLLALVTMVLDHLGYRFFPGELWLRQVGRLAFPLYCFLIAEGFVHTRNRSRYALRLLVLALLSEIPYNLFLSGNLWRSGSLNVFFTLLLGLLAVWGLWHLHERGLTALGVLCVAAAAATAYFIHSDYGFYGILLIVCFACLRDKALLRVLGFAALVGLFVWYNATTRSSTSWAFTQWYGLIAAIPITLYNGKPGPKVFRWGFYLFYPLHLLLFWAINTFL